MVTENEIAERAYALWIERGRPKGYESEIWRDAQLELQTAAPAKNRRSKFFNPEIKKAIQGLWLRAQ